MQHKYDTRRPHLLMPISTLPSFQSYNNVHFIENQQDADFSDFPVPVITCRSTSVGKYMLQSVPPLFFICMLDVHCRKKIVCVYMFGNERPSATHGRILHAVQKENLLALMRSACVHIVQE